MLGPAQPPISHAPGSASHRIFEKHHLHDFLRDSIEENWTWSFTNSYVKVKIDGTDTKR